MVFPFCFHFNFFFMSFWNLQLRHKWTVGSVDDSRNHYKANSTERIKFRFRFCFHFKFFFYELLKASVGWVDVTLEFIQKKIWEFLSLLVASPVTMAIETLSERNISRSSDAHKFWSEVLRGHANTNTYFFPQDSAITSLYRKYIP